MSEPFIYVSTSRIKEGKLEDIKRSAREVVETAQEHEPRLIALHVFINEDGTEMTSIQIHPDAASMDFHMQVLGKHLGEFMDDAPNLIEFKHFEYYGKPSMMALEMDRELAGDAVTLKPVHVAGFTRSTTG